MYYRVFKVNSFCCNHDTCMFNPSDNIVLSNLDTDVKSKEGAYVFFRLF